MDLFEFVVMVEEILICMWLIEYIEIDFESGQDSLWVVGLMDVLVDGLSMVYLFFELLLQVWFFGMFMIFDYIEIVKSMDLFYVYLGYWVFGSEKMVYKVKFSGLEVFLGGVWLLLMD